MAPMLSQWLQRVPSPQRTLTPETDPQPLPLKQVALMNQMKRELIFWEKFLVGKTGVT